MRLPLIVVGTTGDAFCFQFRGSGSIFGWLRLVSTGCKNVAYALVTGRSCKGQNFLTGAY